jgi:hypothetical protein
MCLVMMRVFLFTLLLCSAPTFAQTLPDFSGVFLRNPIASHARFTEPEDSLVLNIKQGVDNLQLTELQNGAQATIVYNLNGKPSISVGPDGVRSKDRIKFKAGRLLIKSEVVDPRLAVPSQQTTEETWELPPDLQNLTIWVKAGPYVFEAEGLRRIETYTRQTSLPVALEKAERASEMNKCNAIPPPMTIQTPPILSDGVDLGYTGFRQLGWEVSFLAGLSGEFLKDLRRTNFSGSVEFRKNGQLMRRYSGPLILEVTPRVTPLLRSGLSILSVFMGKEPLPEWLLTLRFCVKWVGSETRDLGEVPANLRQQPWPKLATPDKLYRLEIAAQDVLLTDSLEIHILSAAGNQLGCISGHI